MTAPTATRTRELRWYDYITININWFALTARSQVLTPLIVPLLVQQFVGDATKGTYVGVLRLWALMAAVLFQAVMGMVSDRSRFRWGRRRPFIVAGNLGEIVVLSLMGLSVVLEGMPGYWIFFGLFLISMLNSNAAQAATNALIPDLVPDERKGTFSGIKAALELPIPLMFVSLVIAPIVARGRMPLALALLSVVLVGSALLTLLVPERTLEGAPPPLDREALIRLLVMTGLFTSVILVMGAVVRRLLLWAQTVELAPAAVVVTIAGILTMSLAVFGGVVIATRVGMGGLARGNWPFRWWVVNRLGFLVGANNMAAFLVFFLQEKFPTLTGERAAGPAATLILFVGLSILLAAPPGGWLSDRIGKKPVIAASGLLAAGGSFIIVLAEDLTRIYAGGSIVGVGVGLFFAASWALGTQMVSSRRAGHLLGISNLAGAGAGAVGAYIGGPIADQMSYSLLMGIYGMVMLVSILALLGIKGQR